MMNVSKDCASDIFQQQAKHFQHILNVINGSYGVINVLNPEGIYISCNTITEDNLQKYALPNYNNVIGKSIFDMVQPEFKGIAQYYLNCAKDCIEKDRQFVKDHTFSATGQRYEELFKNFITTNKFLNNLFVIFLIFISTLILCYSKILMKLSDGRVIILRQQTLTD